MNKLKWNKNCGYLKASIYLIICLAIFCSVISTGIARTTLADEENISADPYVVRRFIDEDGREIEEVIFPDGPPEVKVAAVDVPEPDLLMGTNTLPYVPAFDWCYGCSATSAAMMFGYYDNMGYSNMYTGLTNSGVCPMDNSGWGSGECSLSATHMGYDGLAVRGHVDDYWVAFGNSGPDPYYSGAWTQHIHADCTADFMGTNQWNNQGSGYGNSDGSTRFFLWPSGDPMIDYTGLEPNARDGCHGMRLFAESRGYTVVTNYYQRIYGYPGTSPGKGFTYNDYKAQIDAGRPVMIQVTGHSMLGIGYNDPDTVYLHDTWDYATHSMTWGGTYDGWRQHTAVTVLELTPLGSPADISVSPTGFDETLAPNVVYPTTLTINNTGATSLIYSITDEDTTAAAFAQRENMEAGDSTWLGESPNSGIVGPSSSEDITVSFDTSGLSVGDYSADIVIASNDPDENPTIVPVDLQVYVPMPDLVISEKHEEWVDFGAKTYNIHYTVTNEGDLAAGASTTQIDIDASHIYHACPALNPGASDSVTIGPYVMFGDSDAISVCADTYDVVDESNEGNNCLENEWGTIITGVTAEVNCDALPGVSLQLFDSGGVTPIGSPATSDGSGDYSLAASVSTTGNYLVVASKAGYQDKSQAVTISALGQEYEVDFNGNYGLIPDTAPGIGGLDYFLLCMNLYLEDWGDCNIGMDTFLAVMNAYLELW